MSDSISFPACTNAAFVDFNSPWVAIVGGGVATLAVAGLAEMRDGSPRVGGGGTAFVIEIRGGSPYRPKMGGGETTKTEERSKNK